ncbi:MAG: hypothetical protein ABI867_28960 [Kofleriaceae bacterium]
MFVVVVLAACGSSSKPTPAPPVPREGEVVKRTCSDAAAGLERGTRALREPGVSILDAMRTRCSEDAWSAVAIECFATMTDDKLGACAGMLAPPLREKLFGAIGGDYDEHAAIAMAIARLSSLQVGIAECDKFVAAVATALACEQMPLAQRVNLGNETADFWSLPTARLTEAAKTRMAAACQKSLASLEYRANEAGCK